MIRETHFIITIVVLIVYISSDCEGAPALNPLRPCETTSVLPFIKSNVVRLIPNYNSELLMIQLSGEAKPSFYIAERGLGDFLSSYYKLAKSSLARCLIEDERLRNPMLMTFNLLYLKFLDRVGIRLSCLSYYAGFSQFSSVNQLVLLANNLQKRLRMDNREYTKGKLPPAVLWNPTPVDPGRNLATKLGLNFVPPFAEDFVDLDNTVRPGSPVCNEMFIKLRDSQLVTAFPSYVIQPLTLHIPGDPMQIVDTQSSNATHHLSRYMSSGLKCLDSNLLRKNFSLSLSNWISNKLIPPLVDSTHCIKGFPGIFVLMQSIEAYGNHIEDSTPFPAVISSTSSQIILQRRRRNLSSNQNKVRRSLQYTDPNTISDVELRKKLAVLFGNENERVSDLKIVQDNKIIALVTARPNPRYMFPVAFSTDATEAPKKKFNFGNKRYRYRRPKNLRLVGETPLIAAFQSPPLYSNRNGQTPGIQISPDERNPELTKIGSEVEIDENTLKDQMKVVMEDDKVRAELEVEPLSWNGKPTIPPFHAVFGHDENQGWRPRPPFSPIFAPNNEQTQSGSLLKPVLPKNRHELYRPLYMPRRLPSGKYFNPVQYILQKKYGRDPKKKNLVQKAVSEVGEFFGSIFKSPTAAEKKENEEIQKELAKYTWDDNKKKTKYRHRRM